MVPTSLRPGSHMQGASQVGMKRKALLWLIEDFITQRTQALIFLEDEGDNIEDLILNISIEDLVDDK